MKFKPYKKIKVPRVQVGNLTVRLAFGRLSWQGMVFYERKPIENRVCRGISQQINIPLSFVYWTIDYGQTHEDWR